MDELQTQTPIASTPDPSTQVPTQSAQPVGINTTGGGKKMLILAVVLILVVVALIGGGYYYFMVQNAPPAPAPVVPIKTTQIPAPTATPSPDQDLNAINIDDSSTDFAAIDQNLQTL